MMVQISKKEKKQMSILTMNKNENVPELHYRVLLSNGDTVFQDNLKDHRHPWVRLQNVMKEDPAIKIQRLDLYLNDRLIITTPENKEGYFFGKKLIKVWLSRKEPINSVGIGFFDGTCVKVMWLKLPELNVSLSEERSVEKAGFMFIKNN